MPLNTEQSDKRYETIDRWSLDALAAAILDSQKRALETVGPALPALEAAIETLTETLRGGGRMAYAGAGSSGLVAQLDASEMPGTFGIEPDRVPVILAGGPGSATGLESAAEDDEAAAVAAVDALGLGPADSLIAIAASGATPFTLAALRQARERGAATVGISCVRDAPLLRESRHAILIETPPEIVAGSTRMGAGTAQKCALNILSTGVAVRLGHVYRGLMVNMQPGNAKLRGRAVGIVAQAAGVDRVRAEAALHDAGWSVKTAVVAAMGGCGAAAARAKLREGGGDIRAALSGEKRS